MHGEAYIVVYTYIIEGVELLGTGRHAGKMQHGNAPLFFLRTLCELGIILQTPVTGVAHGVKDEDRVDGMATDAAIAAPMDTNIRVNTRKPCERRWGTLVDDEVIASADAAKKNALGCMPRAIAVSRPAIIEVAIADAPLSASQNLLQRVDGYVHGISVSCRWFFSIRWAKE
jgi:hypothetical protein